MKFERRIEYFDRRRRVHGWVLLTPRLHFSELSQHISTFQNLRDRSKFTGYLGRVLGKICLKKSLRPLFLVEKKSSPPLFFLKKSLRPPFFG